MRYSFRLHDSLRAILSVGLLFSITWRGIAAPIDSSQIESRKGSRTSCPSSQQAEFLQQALVAPSTQSTSPLIIAGKLGVIALWSLLGPDVGGDIHPEYATLLFPGIFKSSRISRDANVFERTATSVTKHKLIAPLYIRYYEKLRRAVNPSGEGIVLGAGGSGVSIASHWIMTGFQYAYFIDIVTPSVSDLRIEHERWSPYEPRSPYSKDQYNDGFVTTSNFRESRAYYAMQELQAMGVAQQDVTILTTEAGHPLLLFRLPEDSMINAIEFVRLDLDHLPRRVRRLLNDRLDVYAQKAVYEMPYHLERQLQTIAQWVKPKKFVLYSPYDPHNNRYPMDAFSQQFVPHAEKAISEATQQATELKKYSNRLYGWALFAFQKLPAVVAKTARRASPTAAMSRSGRHQPPSRRLWAFPSDFLVPIQRPTHPKASPRHPLNSAA